MGRVKVIERDKSNPDPEVLAGLGEPRRMAACCPSFETPRKSAAPQDDNLRYIVPKA